jgi:ABC-type transport system involved in cytochrome bd biosynthesis fused ATPase/permease subunit
MAVEPRDIEPQHMAGEPRRDRRRMERRSEDRDQRLRTAAAAALAICGGLVVVYIFFWAFGAFSLGDAAAATAVVVILGLLWLGGVYYRVRTGAKFITRRDRERRGF